jgi:hypothetical protein
MWLPCKLTGVGNGREPKWLQAINVGFNIALMWLFYSWFKIRLHDCDKLPSPFKEAALPASSLPRYRDTFANYSYRNHASCRISSLDLHTPSPYTPLCSNRTSLLTAMSGGGRIGFEAPYTPRDCDMHWYTTEEICKIFSRFEKVIVVGDSMMRHLVGALNVLLRKDLGYGAVTNWNFKPDEFRDCFCNHQFDVKSCSLQGIFRTADVLKHDPDSLACAQPVDLIIEMMLKFPLLPVEVKRYTDLLSETKPKKPYAFVFGHGLWNDLDLSATLNWLDGIITETASKAPYLSHSSVSSGPAPLFPRLFVSPSAAGPTKPDQFIVSQGDKALQIFEESTRVEVGQRGVEHLGTWNMSIQSNKYDGVHLDLRGNLIKAMAVVNWLGMIEVERW